jgi:methionyl-tRNA formyltransferase
MKLHIAFFGTPSFAAIGLEELIINCPEDIKIAAIITQPDKPVGRKQILTPSPVKEIAQKYKIPLFDISIREEEKLVIFLKKYRIDLGLLYAYGEIITQKILQTPSLGFWNIHPSLLPKYRGSSPMAFPLILAETETGVTLMKMDEQLDHGPIISQEKYSISENKNRSDVETELSTIGFNLFKKAIEEKRFEYTTDQVQEHEKATFTRMLKKDDGYIPFETLKKVIAGESIEYIPKPTEYFYQRNPMIEKHEYSASKTIYNLYRGLYQWPGIWTTITIKDQPKRLKITEVSLSPEEKLTVKKVQLEGKNEVDFETFQNAYKVF